MGARLVCTDDELGEYNLAKAINPFLLYHVSYRRAPKQFSLHSFLEFFKALLVSNPSLLKNKDYVGNGGSTVYFFLIHWIYRLQDFYSCGAPTSVDIRRYQAVVDFFLFTVACLKDLPNANAWVTECLFDGLQFATSLANDIGEQIVIETSQMAILKILFDEMAERQIVWDEQCDASFKNRLRNLIRTERLDLILFIDRQGSLMSDFLNRSANFGQLIDMMTGSRAARRLLQQLLETKPPVSWLSSAKLLFVLLEKKECRSIRKLLQRIPTLIHQLDEEGNDPLLFVCLKVSGCRHRLVEFLVAMGSDWQRRNSHDEHFFQVLQHRRNRTLLERLIEHGVIATDSVTGEFRVSPIEEQHAVGSFLPSQS